MQRRIGKEHTLVYFLLACCGEDEAGEEGSGECDDTSLHGPILSRSVPLQRDVHGTRDLERKENR